MKNRLRILTTLIILTFALTACAFPRLVSRETPAPADKTLLNVSEDLPPFTEIDIDAVGPIFLIQGNTHAIQIDGPKSYVENITYEVSNGVLIIKYSGSTWDLITDRDHPTITINFENLTRFVFEGGSELVANNLQTDSLAFVMRGGASLEIKHLQVNTFDLLVEGGTNIEISGEARTQKLDFSGGIHYDAEDLESASVSLKIEGAASATIWATESLDLDLSGAYDVKYYGNPSLTQSIQGVGNVQGLGEK